MTDLLVRGQPLDDLVWNTLRLDGHLAPATISRPSIERADGTAFFGSRVTVSQRGIVIGLDVRPASIEERTTTIDSLTRRFTGLLPVQTADDWTRVYYCERQAAPSVELYTGTHANPICYVEYLLTAVDPYRYDVEPIPLSLSTTRVACPIGNGTSAPRIWLYGAGTAVVDPVVIVKNAAGDEVSRLTFSVSLGSNTALDIDCATQLVNRYSAGVLQTGTSSGLACVASGEFPVLDPTDASPPTSQWGTVELSSTTGTPTGLILYTRRW